MCWCLVTFVETFVIITNVHIHVWNIGPIRIWVVSNGSSVFVYLIDTGEKELKIPCISDRLAV